MTGRRLAAGLAIAICAVSNPAYASPPETCPISYSKLSMPYNHEHGISTPTVQLTFTNTTSKRIVRAKFGLIVTGPQGEQIPYDQNLSFTEGAEPGKQTSSHWDLDMQKVDIHRLGETIYLESARFEDGSVWQDDGNQRCKQEEYYGPK
jgi:hypothetical protein